MLKLGGARLLIPTKPYVYPKSVSCHREEPVGRRGDLPMGSVRLLLRLKADRNDSCKIFQKLPLREQSSQKSLRIPPSVPILGILFLIGACVFGAVGCSSDPLDFPSPPMPVDAADLPSWDAGVFPETHFHDAFTQNDAVSQDDAGLLDGGVEPDAGEGPFHRDASPDAMVDAGFMDAACVADPCRSNVIVRDLQNPLYGTCLDFTEVHQAVGLPDSLGNRGVSVDEEIPGRFPGIYLLKDGSIPNQRFENSGGLFTDVSQSLGLDILGDSRDALFTDVDGDGNLDLLFVGATGSDLYRFNSGRYEPLPEGMGIHDTNPGRAAIQLGANIYLTTANGALVYRHLGGFNFDPLALMNAIALGLDDPDEGWALKVADYDGDGLEDIYMPKPTGENRLFHARADGTYESTGFSTGTEGNGFGQSVDADWARMQPGFPPSLLVANYNAADELFVNLGQGMFSPDSAIRYGLQDPGNTTRVASGDFVGNGYPGIVMGHRDQSTLFYLPEIDSTGAVMRYNDFSHPFEMHLVANVVGMKVFDYNSDGKPDLLMVLTDGVRLFRNERERVHLCP